MPRVDVDIRTPGAGAAARLGALATVLLAACALFAGCASGDRLGDEDSGERRPEERDTGAGRDDVAAARDVGATDASRDMSETLIDVDLPDDADAAPDGGNVDPGWQQPWTNAPTTNPLVDEVSTTSYQALVVYCSTCADDGFASDPALCLASAFGGGLRVDNCLAGEFDRLGPATIDPWLECQRANWMRLAECTLDPSKNCRLCANNFDFDGLSCAADNPTVVAAADRCGG